MKNRRSMIIVFSILIIGALLLASYEVTQSQYKRFEPPAFIGPTAVVPPTETRVPGCAPYPVAKVDHNIPTPTPGLGTAVNGGSELLISVTPIPIARTIDLSPNVSASEKAVVTVYQCNGTYVQYLVGPEKRIFKDLPLGKGDTIVFAHSPSVHSVEPPDYRKITKTPFQNPTSLSTGTVISTPQNTTAPYPAPNQAVTQANPAIQATPYPAP